MLLLTREYTIHRQLILLVPANIACHKQTQSKVIQFANGYRGWSGDALLPQPTHSPHFLRSFPQSMEFPPPKFHHLVKSPLVAPFPRVDICIFQICNYLWVKKNRGWPFQLNLHKFSVRMQIDNGLTFTGLNDN